jgi:hypothetical protein
MALDFNLTNLKELARICQIAREAFQPEYGLHTERYWLELIDKYTKLLQDEIFQLESGGTQSRKTLFMHTEDKDENGKPLNPFGQILAVMDVEHLIRFRRRLEKVGKRRMVEILTDEIQEREKLAKKEAKQQREDLERSRSNQ